MAELFNPFNRSVTGQAFDGLVPVQLRIEEGSASREQVKAVQHVFAQFARRATFSRAPNPSEHGALGDGSAYRITTVGNTTIVQLWPKGGETPERQLPRGISFCVQALDGSSLPEHTNKAGELVNYVLTPLVNRKGERIANGQFKISRPKAVRGGELSSRSYEGGLYFAGGAVGGQVHTYASRYFRERFYCSVSEQLINTARGQNEDGSGIRGDAYRYGLRFPVDGDFAFIHTTAKGALYLMGLSYATLDSASGLPGGTRITLFVRAYRKNKLAEPAPVRVFTKDITGNIYPPSTTFNARGTEARAHYGNVGAQGVAYMRFGVDGLVVESLDKVLPYTEIIEDGAPGGDSYNYTKTTINHSGDVADYFNRLGEPVGRTAYEGRIVDISTFNRTSTTTTYTKPTGDYDNDGNPVYAEYADVVDTEISSTTRVGSTTAGGANQGMGETKRTDSTSVRTEIGRRAGSSGVVTFTSNGTRTSETTDAAQIFFDDALTGVSVLLVRTVQVSESSGSGYGPDGEYTDPVESTVLLQYHFVIRYQGRDLVRELVPEYVTDWDATLLNYSFSCNVALDVDTDCLLLYIAKNHLGLPIKSWAYLVGRRFIKPLSDVLPLNVPVRLDAQLMTV